MRVSLHYKVIVCSLLLTAPGFSGGPVGARNPAGVKSPKSDSVNHQQPRGADDALPKQSADANCLLRRACDLLSKKEPQKAIAICDQVIAKKLRLGDAYYLRASGWMSLGQMDNAISDITKAIDQQPENCTWYKNRAEAYYLKGQQALAARDRRIEAFLYELVNEYNQDVVESPAPAAADSHSFDREYISGQQAYMRHEFANSVKHFSNALQLNPTCRSARFFKARALEALDLRQAAIQEYTVLLASNEHFLPLELALGGSPSEPEKEWYKVNLPKEVLNQAKGRCYWGLSDYKNAIAEANIFCSKHPDECLTYWFRGKILQDAHLYSLAIADYRMIGELTVTDANLKHEAAYRLARCYHAAKDYPKAIEQLNALINQQAEDEVLLDLLGDSYSKLGQHKEAIRKFARVIELEPTSSQAFRRRGEEYELIGDLKDSLADYDKAVSQSASARKSIDALLDRSRVLEKLGNKSAADADKAKIESLKTKSH